jgi:hypothetical protein
MRGDRALEAAGGGIAAAEVPLAEQLLVKYLD